MRSIFVYSFLLLLSFITSKLVKCAVVPKLVKGVNEVISTIKDGMVDAIDCMTLRRPPTIADVNFYLFTNKTKKYPEEIKNLEINKSHNFNHDFLTKVLIHGYTQSYKNEHFIKMKDGKMQLKLKSETDLNKFAHFLVFLENSDVNVIMVNWENLAFCPCYPIAADYTTFVGQLTGYLLEKLSAYKVHLIGFSLGAHIAAIGAQMQQNKVLRITGLDPAGPMFLNNPANRRLDKEDAQNVDVIHTSAVGFGTITGHADFFVNGGKVQPGCSTTDVSCCHRRSLELYLESITSSVSFKATICDSLNNFESNKCANNTYSLMGEPWLINGAKRGKFFIRTNSTSPYALRDIITVAKNATLHNKEINQTSNKI